MERERSFYLAFSNTSGIGPIKFNKLVKTFGSAKLAWNMTGPDLVTILNPALTKKFIDFRQKFDIEEYLQKLKKQKISFACLIDKEYPDLLKQIPNPPIVLYAKGNLKLLRDSQKIAVVGTRHITSYGRQITEMFTEKLSDSGLTIVSGMAYGVDGVAHKACLKVGGNTIAVLGNGVDMPYPRENEKLYEEILDNNGLIISEYPPGEPPSVGSFPARNRIVAGLSQGVLVTEGASDSGSLITANYGLEFGRKVFAIPGPITSQLSAAPLRLIEKGARLVVSPEDILRNLQLPISNFQSNKNDSIFKNLSKEEKKIVELIENEPLHFDEIVRRLKLDPAKTGTILSMMEIRGIIKSNGGKYSITGI